MTSANEEDMKNGFVKSNKDLVLLQHRNSYDEGGSPLPQKNTVKEKAKNQFDGLTFKFRNRNKKDIGDSMFGNTTSEDIEIDNESLENNEKKTTNNVNNDNCNPDVMDLEQDESPVKKSPNPNDDLLGLSNSQEQSEPIQQHNNFDEVFGENN